MRLAKPRIAPLAAAEWTAEQREVLEPLVARSTQAQNLYATLGRNPAALKAFTTWGAQVLLKSSLPARERELVILRIGWLCRSGYEWSQHSLVGKRAGLTDQEIERVKAGAEAAGWTATEAALLRAADELHHTYFISDATWQVLTGLLSEQQCMDVVFVAAHYTQVSMILNTFGIQLEAGMTLDETLRHT